VLDDEPRVHQIKRFTRRVIDGQTVLQHLRDAAAQDRPGAREDP
jgi:hypothetical protein